MPLLYLRQVQAALSLVLRILALQTLFSTTVALVLFMWTQLMMQLSIDFKSAAPNAPASTLAAGS
jgi:hypothetical protein